MREPNADDQQARRLAGLVIALETSRAPLPTSEIIRLFYLSETEEEAGSSQGAPGSVRQASLLRKFERDRERLAMIGITLVRSRQSGETAWSLSPDCLAQDANFSDDDLRTLRLACETLVNDPSFPLQEDLMFALAKLDRHFQDESGTFTAHLPRDRKQRALTAALSSHTPVRVRYATADGTPTNRTLALYGAFGLRDHIYYVGATMDEDGAAVMGKPHTYRSDRFIRVSLLHTSSYQVPGDFSREQYVKLPFQLGKVVCTGTFSVPSDAEDALLQTLRAQGTLDIQTSTWRTDISDILAAASWAIAEELTPLAPVELVDAWKQLLDGVMRHD